MAREIVWTNPAADNLVETVEYIGKDSEAYAAALAQRVVGAAESLAALPNRGAPFRDPAYPGYRQLVIGSHLLVYEVEDERVLIHGVFHGHRRRSGLFREQDDEA